MELCSSDFLQITLFVYGIQVIMESAFVYLEYTLICAYVYSESTICIFQLLISNMIKSALESVVIYYWGNHSV